jgi:hypothetical protein
MAVSEKGSGRLWSEGKMWFCTCHKDPCEKHPTKEARAVLAAKRIWDRDSAALDKTDFLPAPPRVLNLEHGVLDLDTGVLRIFLPGKTMIVETLKVDEAFALPGELPEGRPAWSVVCEAKSRIAQWL